MTIPRAAPIVSLRQVIVAALLCLAVFAPVQRASAQDVMRIAAVVNDDVISVYDLVQRVRLVILSTGLEDTDENRQRLVPQVMRTLIDEHLQLQMAREQNISIPDERIEDAIVDIEQQNGMAAGDFDRLLQRANIDRSTMEQQIRSGLAWSRVLERRMLQEVQISDEEIDEAYAEIQASSGQPQSQISEIFLAVDTPAQEAEIRASAYRIYEQARGGATFSALAQQFSQSATATLGGDLGWIRDGQLPEEIATVVKSLTPGEIAEPIRSTSGYYIVQLRDRRTVDPGAGIATKVTMEHMFLPLPAGVSDVERKNAVDLATLIGDTVTDCGDLVRLRDESGARTFGLPNEATLTDLPGEIQTIVSPLQEGEISDPVQTGSGVLIVMVCKREDIGDIMREDIRQTLVRDRLDIISRRLMRDLRNSAFVDLRI
jgi:peptidyl-prolyl cis-trans isomerase SurA